MAKSTPETTGFERWTARSDRNLLIAILAIWIGGGLTVAAIIGSLVWVVVHA